MKIKHKIIMLLFSLAICPCVFLSASGQPNDKKYDVHMSQIGTYLYPYTTKKKLNLLANRELQQHRIKQKIKQKVTSNKQIKLHKG